MALAPDYLGRGILRPLVRDEKNDFANDTGIRLVAACVGQVLGTRLGEIPWRPAFGSRLYLLLHRPNNPTLDDLARFYVLEAVARWEKRARIKKVRLERAERDRVLRVEVSFDIVDRFGTVIAKDATLAVSVEGGN